MTEGEDEMRCMIERLENYLKRKRIWILSLNKTKIMRFKKRGGREIKKDWRWQGKKIQEVKEFGIHIWDTCFRKMGDKKRKLGR